MQRIEYKPRFIVQLLAMPYERHQNEVQDGIVDHRWIGYKIKRYRNDETLY